MRVHVALTPEEFPGARPRGRAAARGRRAPRHDHARSPPATRAARRIVPVADADEARGARRARPGAASCWPASAAARRSQGFDLGNSPLEFTARARRRAHASCFTTTNGTAALLTARAGGRGRRSPAHQRDRGRALGARAGPRRDRAVRGRAAAAFSLEDAVCAGLLVATCSRTAARRGAHAMRRPGGARAWASTTARGSTGWPADSGWARKLERHGPRRRPRLRACGSNVSPMVPVLRGAASSFPGPRGAPIRRRSARSRAREPPDRADAVPDRAGPARHRLPHLLGPRPAC